MRGPAVVVLDDAHLLSHEAWEPFEWIVRNQPPNVHFVVVSRADPPFSVARFRASGWLTEVRESDLELTVDQVAALLERWAHEPVDRGIAEAIRERTEGWAAGLRLAMLAFENGASLHLALRSPAIETRRGLVRDRGRDGMRVLSWNMAYWKPGRFNTVANRRRQWALIGALCPDIALLQECRPPDLAVHGAGWMADEYDIIGAIPHRWTACSTVLARRSLQPIALDRTSLPADERRWLDYLSGYVATAWMSAGGRPVTVASVHTVAREVDDDSVTPTDHERMGAGD